MTLPYYYVCNLGLLITPHHILKTALAQGIFASHFDAKQWGYIQWTMSMPDKKAKQLAIKNLVEGGCDIDVKDSEGKTPLHWLSYSYDNMFDSERTINTMLDCGADINAQDNQKLTPVTWLAMADYGHRCGNPEVETHYGNLARLLFRKSHEKYKADHQTNVKFDPAIQDDTGTKSLSSLWVLELHGNHNENDDLLKALQDVKCDFDMKDGCNKTMMDWAVTYSWGKVVRYLHHSLGIKVTKDHQLQAVNNPELHAMITNYLSEQDGVQQLPDAMKELDLSGDHSDSDVDLYS